MAPGATGSAPDATPVGPALRVFHDESGDFGHGEWAFVGMLWVRRAEVAALGRELAALREPGAGEVHFYRFPRGFGGSFGATARTAQAWFEHWRGPWLRRVWFNALAVNRHHPRYDAQALSRPEVAYQHVSGLCLRTGLRAFFAREAGVSLEVCSDERAGMGEGHGAAPGTAAGPRTQTLSDALSAAVTVTVTPGASEAGASGGGPLVAPLPIPTRSMSSALAGAGYDDEQELLQLTDLLLGAVSTAILPRGVAATKLWFAREMARLMEQIRRPAGEGAPGAHGHLLVSYFPDPVGRIYHDGQIGLWDL